MEFKDNRVARLFGIRYPIVQAGMVWCSGWRLAAAVSGAGGLGLIGAGSMTPEILREHIQKCREAVPGKPFGVNVPLIYAHVEAIFQVLEEEDVRIVFTSAGTPKTWTPGLKARGCVVAHVVPGARFAKKAEAAGVDAVVCEGFEAGGHNGPDETTTMCLVPAVAKAVEIPVVAAGGIADGRAMLAAFALGAEGAQIGSRFAASRESSAHENFKAAVTAADEGATRLALKKLTPVRMLRNAFYEEVRELEARGANAEELRAALGKGRSRRGIFEGDLDAGELEIGQAAALIDDLPPAAELVERIVSEYAVARQALLNDGRFGA